MKHARKTARPRRPYKALADKLTGKGGDRQRLVDLALANVLQTAEHIRVASARQKVGSENAALDVAIDQHDRSLQMLKLARAT